MTARQAWDQMGKWLIAYATRIGGGYGWDECVSDAHFGFMEAFQTWADQRDTFAEWAKHKVRKTVRHRIEKEHARRKLCIRVQCVLERLADHRPAWTLQGFLEGMSPDMEVAVRTALSIDTVDRIIRQERRFKAPSWGFDSPKLKRVLRARLAAKGWSKSKIDETIARIGEALR